MDGYPDGFPKILRTLGDCLSIIEVLRNDRETGVFVANDKWTKNRFPYGLWFRGELDHEMNRLSPGVFRDKDLSESFITNHLDTRVLDLNRTKNAFDKLCLAQHYNVPTRLLDWTESLLVAIYFAVGEYPDPADDATDRKLYVLNAYRLNEIGGLDEGKGKIHTSTDWGTLLRSEIAFCSSRKEWGRRVSTQYPEYKWQWVRDLPCNVLECVDGLQLRLFSSPIAVLPVRTRQRMVVQSSAFTLHGGATWGDDTNEEVPRRIPECTGDSANRRVFIESTIPHEFASSIRRELYDLGIHEGSLFPEMERQRNVLEQMAQI